MLITLATNTEEQSLGLFDYIGIGIWAIGLSFEAVGDYQMAVFKAGSKPGDVMRTGLWKYTRHPCV